MIWMYPSSDISIPCLFLCLPPPSLTAILVLPLLPAFFQNAASRAYPTNGHISSETYGRQLVAVGILCLMRKWIISLAVDGGTGRPTCLKGSFWHSWHFRPIGTAVFWIPVLCILYFGVINDLSQ